MTNSLARKLWLTAVCADTYVRPTSSTYIAVFVHRPFTC